MGDKAPRDMPQEREEVNVTTKQVGNQTIKTTVTKTYHHDGSVSEHTRTETTTRTRVESPKQRTKTETKVRTTTKNGRRVEQTTVITHYNDGSTSEKVSEKDKGPDRTSTHRETVVTTRPRGNSSGDRNALNSDIDRLTAENELKRATRGRDCEAIDGAILTCRKWDSNPATKSLIEDGWKRLMHLDPSRGAAIAEQMYKDLPFSGMKIYLYRNHGVSRDLVDNVPGPYYKWELHKLAEANGITFPDNRRALEALGRQKSARGYNGAKI